MVSQLLLFVVGNYREDGSESAFCFPAEPTVSIGPVNSGLVYASVDVRNGWSAIGKNDGGSRMFEMLLDNGVVANRMGVMWDNMIIETKPSVAFAGAGNIGPVSTFPQTNLIWYQIVMTVDLDTGTVTSEARNYTDDPDTGDPAYTVYDLGTSPTIGAVSGYTSLRVHCIPNADSIPRYDNLRVATTPPELIQAVIPGDANLDDIVDSQDFGILKDNFGLSGGWGQGDFNGDSIVDSQDFGIHKDHFGDTLPEPATLGLLLIGGLALLRRRS